MTILATFYCVFTLLMLCINGVEESKWKLAREDIAQIEKQIQLQTNYTVKTIRTRHGDLYDCVNFDKQPAFNHPLSKNHNFIPQNKPTLSQEKSRNNDSYVISQTYGLRGRGCPDGTVPIKRVTREDLIRAKYAQAKYTKPVGTLYARCSAQENTGYSGVSAGVADYNPTVNEHQYSAAVMKLQIGPDSIEVGWRVDPTLYHDHKTHLYIRTDARDIHCFNTLCPGFRVTDTRRPVDSVLDKISKPGELAFGVNLSISKDTATGHWILSIGNMAVGYWPDELFQQPGLAQYVEWGGEVFSQGGVQWPGMGSGQDFSENIKKDAHYSFVKVKNGASSQFVDPVNVKCKAQDGAYEVKDEGNVGKDIEYLIIYGGPETSN